MSEREGSQRERGARRAGRPALAPAALAEERAQREREGSQCQRALAPAALSEERAQREREGSRREGGAR